MKDELTTPARRSVPGIGALELIDFDTARHTDIAHAWLTDPHAHYWGMTEQSRAETGRYFERIAAATTHTAWMGLHEGRPAFLTELYAPEADAVGAFYEVAAGDRGMHILIAPPETRIPGFTWAVFSFVVDTVFEATDAERIVVEPDIDNAGIHRLNERAGFTGQRRIDMGEKTALFCTLSRADHARQRAATSITA